MAHDFDTLVALASEHGDAFYLVDTDRFRTNLRALQASFGAVYPRTRLAYSYKTNYLPLLCRVADEEGCLAEVVSGMEYAMARRVGIPGERIIFNGPAKSPGELEEALIDGALVNIDSLAEVESIEDIAARHPGARLRLGLRCHLRLSDSHESRFGMQGEELAGAHDRLRRISNVTVEGLHCHASSVRDAASYAKRARTLVSYAGVFFGDHAPVYLDLGGGFYGQLPPEMRAQFEGEVPSWDEVAQAVGAVLNDAFQGAEGSVLVLEPGAAVVADAVEFVCRVAATKRLDSRTVAVVTGSIHNIKARPNRIRLPLAVVRDPEHAPLASTTGRTDVTGYTCLEADVLATDVEGELQVGDFLVFSHVGAYTNVFKPPFIRPAPAMLVLGPESGGVAIARRAELLDDVLATYADRPQASA